MTPRPAAVPSHEEADDETADDRLMRQTAAGDARAFETLVRRHQKAALAVAWRLLGDQDLAHDATQRAFLELHRYVGRYRGDGRFRALLHRIVLNHAKMLQRSRRRFARLGDRLGREPLPAPGPDLEAHVESTQQQAGIDRALLSLSEPLRDVLALRYGGGLSLQEIADSLQIPLGTVKSRLNHGVAQLRRELQEARDG